MPPQDPGSFACLQPAGGAASIPALPGAGGGRVRRRLLACESCRGSCGASGVCGVSVLSPIYLSLCHLPPRGGRRLPRCRGFLSLSIYSASRAGACAAPLGLCRGCSEPPGGIWGSSGVPQWDARRPRDGSEQPGPTLLRGLGGELWARCCRPAPPPQTPELGFAPGGPCGGPPPRCSAVGGCARLAREGALYGVSFGALRGVLAGVRSPSGLAQSSPFPSPGRRAAGQWARWPAGPLAGGKLAPLHSSA